MSVGRHTVLWLCAGVAGRINILVEKAASVVWLNMDSLEAQAEGGMTPELNSILNNTSHPSVN